MAERLRSQSRRLVALAALGSVAALLGLVAPVDAQTAPRLALPTPSDPRAAFVIGNAMLCGDAEVGFPSSVRLGALNNGTTDGNVTAVVTTNAGPVQTGTGQELNVTARAGVVIDAVVVKGGPSFNVYTNPSVLPPTLGSPQHYISPFNVGGAVPDISHWFVCYHLTTPPAVGTLVVNKAIVPPEGIPVTPLPLTITAVVTCDVPDFEPVLVVWGIGGGRGIPETVLEGIPVDTVCTVVENRANLPAGTSVTYNPPGAPTTGVVIGAEAGVTVTITNDFSALAVQRADLRIEKVVVNPNGVTVPASFAVHLVCDDTTDAVVTLPGAGGVATSPTPRPRVGAVCTLLETTSLPAGWVVTYSVAGAAPIPTQPVFNITSGTPVITVTVTNNASALTTTTTTSTTTTSTTSTTTPPGGDTGAGGAAAGSGAAGATLPRTGASTSQLVLLLAAVLVTSGGVAVLAARRPRR
jgi:LPXTG-motif cell wall-anchored protein